MEYSKEDDSTKESPEMKEDRTLLEQIRDRYAVMVEADEDNRDQGMEDLEFVTVPGNQWDDNMKQERGERPCYEFNKLRVTCKRVINEMRANRPSGKVRGVEDGDTETAEVYSGLIRNIWNNSDGDSVIDHAAEYQVQAGMGAWRISTRYVSDDVFDQDIVIESIPNPFCLYADPSSKDPLKRDAYDWILTERISKKEYKKRWPKVQKVSWEGSEYDDDDEWEDDETIRIAEYWWKEPVIKEIWQLEDGKVIDSESDEAAAIDQELIKKRRTIETHKIMMCIASGEAILEKPIEQAGKEHRFVMIFGEYIIVDGKVLWFGLPRFAKDAQRSYNVSRTAITETIAQAPQAKWWSTVEQAKGHTEKWAEAHKKNFPFLLFNADPKYPGTPQRMGGADVPIALIQESQLASEEIKAVTGIFSPDLGAGDNAKSGVQERERRAQGQIATFNYQDNQTKGVLRTWEILIDLIPLIYDTERTMRVLGEDDSEEYVKINSMVQGEGEELIKVHDLAEGKYDVTVTAGPSFATQRQEASETYGQMAQSSPELMAVAGDLIVKALDLPYADEISERIKAMLPPEIQQIINKDAEMTPEAQQMMQQAQQAMQVVEQQMQQVQLAAQEADKGKAEAEKANSEVQKSIANLKTEEAQFETKIAKLMAAIAQKQSALQIAEINNANVEEKDGLAQERETLSQQVAEAMEQIALMTQEFVNQAANAVNEIQQRKDTEKPKVLRIESRRENGKLVAIPVYE